MNTSLVGKWVVGLAFLLVLIAVGFFQVFKNILFSPTETKLQNGFSPEVTQTGQPVANSGSDSSSEPFEIVADNLEIPWAVAFLPDETLLVTERPGRVVRILPESRQTIPVEGVSHRGEGGLLGIALHPQFTETNWVYLYFTSRTNSSVTNRVERFVFDTETNELRDKHVVLDNIPGALNHDGGALAFGPDGYLYISTGDAGNEAAAQDTTSLAGKILRVRDDGTIPADNPFGTAVYSYGHRNVQGLAWEGDGTLWATEHGPSGLQTGNDEINLIKPGGNYGWPEIRGNQTHPDMISPVIESGSDETWAPGEITILGNKLLFTGLRGASLYVGTITADKNITELTVTFRNSFGRLRAVFEGPDGWLYVTTSNRDGRGTPQPGDDKLLRINPALL